MNRLESEEEGYDLGEIEDAREDIGNDSDTRKELREALAKEIDALIIERDALTAKIHGLYERIENLFPLTAS